MLRPRPSWRLTAGPARDHPELLQETHDVHDDATLRQSPVTQVVDRHRGHTNVLVGGVDPLVRTAVRSLPDVQSGDLSPSAT